MKCGGCKRSFFCQISNWFYRFCLQEKIYASPKRTCSPKWKSTTLPAAKPDLVRVKIFKLHINFHMWHLITGDLVSASWCLRAFFFLVFSTRHRASGLVAWHFVLVQRKLHFPSKEEEIVQRDSVFLSADGFLSAGRLWRTPTLRFETICVWSSTISKL